MLYSEWERITKQDMAAQNPLHVVLFKPVHTIFQYASAEKQQLTMYSQPCSNIVIVRVLDHFNISNACLSADWKM